MNLNGSRFFLKKNSRPQVDRAQILAGKKSEIHFYDCFSVSFFKPCNFNQLPLKFLNFQKIKNKTDHSRYHKILFLSKNKLKLKPKNLKSHFIKVVCYLMIWTHWVSNVVFWFTQMVGFLWLILLLWYQERQQGLQKE